MAEFTLDLVPEGDTGGFHIPNLPGEQFRTRLVDSPGGSSTPLRTKIKLVEVHHGRMAHEGVAREATLLLLDMTFIASSQNHRYQSISVTMEFFAKGDPPRPHPDVIAYAPKGVLHLNRTRHDRTTRYGGSVGAQTGVDLAKAEAGAHWEVETNGEARFKATLTGQATYSYGYYTAENAVKWTMDENKGEKDGVPSFLRTAVLLARDTARPFYATVRIESKVDGISAVRRALRFNTDEDRVIDDVTFNPQEEQLRSTAITGIRDDDLKHMETLPISRYFRVSLVEDEGSNSNSKHGLPAEPAQPGAGGDLPQAGLSAPAESEVPHETVPRVLQQASPPVSPAPTALTNVTEAKTSTTASLALTADAVGKLADAASKAAEAAARSADAAKRAADAVVRAAEALERAAAAAERGGGG